MLKTIGVYKQNDLYSFFNKKQFRIYNNQQNYPNCIKSPGSVTNLYNWKGKSVKREEAIVIKSKI